MELSKYKKIKMENKKFEIPQEKNEGSQMIEFAAEFGFEETGEMAAIRKKMIKILKMTAIFPKSENNIPREFSKTINKALDIFDSLYTQYERLAVGMANQKYGDDYKRAQVGFMIAEASVFRASGYMFDYESKVDQIMEYADNMGYKEIEEGYWIL